MKAKLFGEKCLTIILAILLFFLVPIIIILSSPLFLIRYLVKFSAKYVNPSLGKMVTTRGSALTADGIFQRAETNICSEILLEGNVDVEKAQELIGQRLSDARFPSGDLKYPELKQYMTTWGGYWFFKDDPDFDFKNHIQLHEKCKGDGDHFTEQDVEDFHEEFLNKRWQRKRPLWEIRFLPNYYIEDRGPYTVLLVRFHHALSDGFSWMPMFVKDVCQSEVKIPEPNFVKRSLCSSILFGISFPFFAAYEFAKMLAITFKKLPFRTSKMQTGKYFMKRTAKIPLKKLKEIKTHFKVSFSSVLFAVAGGALRDFLIKARKDVPTTLPGITIQPLANHPEKLRNYMTGIIINFPTGESDPVARLKICQKNFESQKNSTAPILSKYLLMVMGSYFAWMIKFIGCNFAVPTGMTNFPGGTDYACFNGAEKHKFADRIISVGLQRGVCGLAICALSYVDGFRFMLVGDSEVLSKNDLVDVSQLVPKHIDILHCLLKMDEV